MKKSREVWKDIPGYEGLYQASTEGRIKRLAHDSEQRNQYSSYVRHYDEYITTGTCDNEGYCLISLQDSHGVYKQYKVHRLIMMTFSSEWDPNKQVDHIYGVKNDNRLSQLRMVTQEENQFHYWNDECFQDDRKKKFFNRTFSSEYRSKLSQSNKKRKGWKWIHKDRDIRFVSPEDFEELVHQGWKYGMGPLQSENLKSRPKCVYMNKEGVNKRIELNQVDAFMNDGWSLGRCTRKENNAQ